MARPRHLLHAPITEALIDVQVTPSEDVTFPKLKSAIESLDFGYYLKTPIAENSFAWMIASDQQQQHHTHSALIGLRWHSQDEKYVAQFRLNGFTLSRLPPYENWPMLLDEAKRIWTVYVAQLAPRRVIRLATRYINNLNLPMEPGVSFQEYLHKFADVPNEAPQAVDSFFQRFQLADNDTGDRVVLTLALDQVASGAPIPVILDVDAFVVTNLDPNDQNIWNTLDRLRELKNRSFFGTITERAAELFE